MHESAHVFLWLLRELGTDAEASPRIRQDWETIRDFLGAADDAPLTREQHETLASTFERYLAEGRAPAPELEGAFARMKEWFLGVYRSLRDVAPDIAPDVRAVMDRMLGADADAARTRMRGESPGAAAPPTPAEPRNKSGAGGTGGQPSALTALTREQHERLASTFERYLGEGRAPADPRLS